MIDIDPIKKWFAEKLDMQIPETQLIYVPETFICEDLEGTLLFTPGFMSIGEVDFNAMESTINLALSYMMMDREFSGYRKQGIEFHLRKAVKEILDLSVELMKKDQNLVRYIKQHTGERIYILPSYVELWESAQLEDRINIESQFVHELFHNEQKRRKLIQKYPSLIEAPAWILQFLYGASFIGYSEYRRRHNILMINHRAGYNPTTDETLLKIAQIKQRTLNIGQSVLTRTLDINMKGDPNRQLEKFKSIFSSPRYENMAAMVAYRFYKPIVLEALR